MKVLLVKISVFIMDMYFKTKCHGKSLQRTIMTFAYLQAFSRILVDQVKSRANFSDYLQIFQAS